MKQLLDELFDGRRDWIIYKAPRIEEVLEQFPPLRSGKIVMIIKYTLIIHTIKLIRDFKKLEPDVVCLEEESLQKFAGSVMEAVQELAITRRNLQTALTHSDTAIDAASDPQGIHIHVQCSTDIPSQIDFALLF